MFTGVLTPTRSGETAQGVDCETKKKSEVYEGKQFKRNFLNSETVLSMSRRRVGPDRAR